VEGIELKLFDNIDRTYEGPASFAEPNFAYMNRSARSYHRHLRGVLEGWFADYPEDDKAELRSQFRSEINSQHLGALFELYCYALLRGQGFDVEVHPEAAEGKTTRPDFLVRRSGEQLFYVESTLAADAVFDAAEQKRLDQFYDDLNERLHSPDFFIGADIEKAPLHSPPVRRICSFLEENLRDLDADEVAKAMAAGDLDDYVRWTWTDGEWEVVFWPSPKSPEQRGQPGVRPLGQVLLDLGEIEPEKPLLKSFKRKAGRYGRLNSPYIIAVNATDMMTDENDVADALFGRKTLFVNKETKQGAFVRSPDHVVGSGGLWIGPGGKRQNRRVSAVLVALWMDGGNMLSIDTPVLWHNPWADYPLDRDLWEGPQKVTDPETLETRDIAGRTHLEILGVRPTPE
jgi:hypothetical protein